MYPNILRIMTAPLKKSQRTTVLVYPLLLVYLMWWIWHSSGGSLTVSDRRLLGLLLGLAVITLLSIPLARWSQRKAAKRQMNRFTDDQLGNIERDCAAAEPVGGIVVTADALVGPHALVPIDDLVWVYLRAVTHRMAATTHEVVAVTADKREQRIYLGTRIGPFRREKGDVSTTLAKQLLAVRPGIFLGSTPEHQALYRDDFEKMAALAGQGPRT